MTLKLGWFTAGRGPGSRAMFECTLDAIKNGSLDARIDFVFMHRQRGESEGSDAFMDFAMSRGIPVVALSSQVFRNERGGDFATHRDEYDAQVRTLLSAYAPDLCVLAGYLLILSEPMTHAYSFVNLHAALPDGPVGLWQTVIWELISARSPGTGVVVFSVTADLDRGPIVAYCHFPIAGPHFDPLWEAVEGVPLETLRLEGENQTLFSAIRSEGLKREPLLLVEALNIIVHAGGRPPMVPRDMTNQVEAALAARMASS